MPDTARYWREENGVVKVSGSMVVEFPSSLRGAMKDSKGNFLFSEMGAGVKPLVLEGMWNDVLNMVARDAERGCLINNIIHELPEIYIGFGYSYPSKAKILDPVGDTVNAIVKGIAGFAPGSELTDIVGAIGDMHGIYQDIFGNAKKKIDKKLSKDPVYIRIHYLQHKGMFKIGERQVHFRDLHGILVRGLSAMA